MGISTTHEVGCGHKMIRWPVTSFQQCNLNNNNRSYIIPKCEGTKMKQNIHVFMTYKGMCVVFKMT